MSFFFKIDPGREFIDRGKVLGDYLYHSLASGTGPRQGIIRAAKNSNYILIPAVKLQLHLRVSIT
ncbi:hypothetical protein [uncultured Mucilaginibacter sp.]|uniref:hypothetical protein n=1 Tax=uncultured Mucilaginibacter sp. TaxID=797541 RepID=UPI0025FDC8EC|nr:hypothetical protein [uncultured Mucilaginibacter sp.]